MASQTLRILPLISADKFKGDKLSHLSQSFLTIATTANAPFAGIGKMG